MQHLPPLNALRAFESAVRHMSFQKAAEELHVTPAALSYQIRHLEESLGVALFIRHNRAISLTPQGELIAPGVHDAFEQLSRTMYKLRRSTGANVLTVSAGPAFTSKWLAPRLYRFLVRHPELDARVSASLTAVNLEHGDVDVALRFGRGEYPHCTSMKLFDEYVIPLCSPSLRDTPPGITEPNDLRRYNLIHDDSHVGLFEVPDWAEWLHRAGADRVDAARHGLYFNVPDHALNAAIAGAVVVLGREVIASADIEAGRLVAPFQLKIKTDYSFYAVWLKARSNEPAIQAFIRWLEDEVRGDTGPSVVGPAV